MALGNRGNQALVVMLVRIRMKKVMKLLGGRQTEQSQPKSKHQNASGNPAETANLRYMSCLQVVRI